MNKKQLAEFKKQAIAEMPLRDAEKNILHKAIIFIKYISIRYLKMKKKKRFG